MASLRRIARLARQAPGGLGAVAGPIGMAAEALQQLVGVAKQFTEALSPVTVQLFDQAMRNLQATVGQALIPVVQVFTKSLQDVASILDGPMKALAPTVTAAVQSIAAGLIPIVQILVAGLQLLQPFIDILIELQGPMTQLEEVLGSLIAAFISVKAALDPFAPLKLIVDQFTVSMREAIKSVVIFAATTLKFFGREDIIDAWKKNLEQMIDAGRVQNASIQSPAVKGLEQIVKDLATASVMAGGGPTPEDKSLAELQKIVDILSDIRNNSEGKSQDEIGGDLLLSAFKVLGHIGGPSLAPAISAAGRVPFGAIDLVPGLAVERRAGAILRSWGIGGG